MVPVHHLSTPSERTCAGGGGAEAIEDGVQIQRNRWRDIAGDLEVPRHAPAE